MNRYESIASPSMIVSFICMTFGLMSFSSAMMDLQPDSVLAMAIIRLVLGAIYFLGALINLLRGLPGGNLNLIFSVCFGLFAGSNMLLGVFEKDLGLQIQPEIYGIVQIFASIYLLALLPAMQKAPLYQCCSFFCSACGLMLQGLRVLTGQAVLDVIAGWFFLGFAVLSLYTGLCGINPSLPQGISQRQFWKKLSAALKKQR